MRFETLESLCELFPSTPGSKLLLLRQLIRGDVDAQDTYSRVFGAEFDRRKYYDSTPAGAGYIPEDVECACILLVADKLLETFGVEYLGGDVYYCNTGETYDVTLLYDERADRFFVGCWGNLVEANPRRFGASE